MAPRTFWFWPLGHKRQQRVRSYAVCLLPRVFCISPAARRFFRILIQYSLLGFVLFILILWLGMEHEQFKVKQQPKTLYLYELPQVCGLTYPIDYAQANLSSKHLEPLEIRTFPNASSVVNATNIPANHSQFVAHCGECGQCSNPQDIKIYDETKNSLFGASVNCAKRGLIWGRKTASNCMKEAVGFTNGCNDCWVENIICDLRKCIFSCMWHALFSEIDTGGASQELNICTECDEKRCGVEFVTCAGANRRRSGILSDIERDLHTEVCASVKHAWWNDTALQAYWHATQPVKEQGTLSGRKRSLR